MEDMKLTKGGSECLEEKTSTWVFNSLHCKRGLDRQRAESLKGSARGALVTVQAGLSTLFRLATKR